MEYSPAGFVLVAVGTAVATLVAVTVAPATMAPEESVTMPRMAPVTVCAKAGQWGSKRTSAHANDFEISFIILSPLSGTSLAVPHQAPGKAGICFLTDNYEVDRRNVTIIQHNNSSDCYNKLEICLLWNSHSALARLFKTIVCLYISHT